MSTASGSSDEGQLRSIIQAAFKQRHLSGSSPFWEKAVIWRTLCLAAEHLGQETKDASFGDLADWFDSADSHSLSLSLDTSRD
jgi:hypothetical protein